MKCEAMKCVLVTATTERAMFKEVGKYLYGVYIYVSMYVCTVGIYCYLVVVSAIPVLTKGADASQQRNDPT